REESLLLVAEGFDGVEAGGFHGGPDAEDEADTDADDDAGRCGPYGHDAGPAERGANQEHESVDQYEGKDSAGSGERHRFEQELPCYVAAARADGFADTDLACAFGHADEHDVHHADAADEQADGAKHHRRDVNHQHDAVELFDF